MSDTPLVAVSVDGPVATLTLNNPRHRNMLTPALCTTLSTLVQNLTTAGEISVLIITGEDPAFCAGANLGDLATSSIDNSEVLRNIYAGFLSIFNTPLITIAAVNGPAVGAGMNLALACDLRLASEHALFDTRFLELGIHPGGGHTWMLQRIVGSPTARAMVLANQKLDASAALTHGLVSEVCAHDELGARAFALATSIAATPRSLLLKTKRTMDDTAKDISHAAAVERELTDQLWSVEQPFFTERLQALQTKIHGSRESH